MTREIIYFRVKNNKRKFMYYPDKNSHSVFMRFVNCQSIKYCKETVAKILGLHIDSIEFIEIKK